MVTEWQNFTSILVRCGLSSCLFKSIMQTLPSGIYTQMHMHNVFTCIYSHAGSTLKKAGQNVLCKSWDFTYWKSSWTSKYLYFIYLARGKLENGGRVSMEVPTALHPPSPLTIPLRKPPANQVKLSLPTCLSYCLTPGTAAIPLPATGCVEPRSPYRGGTLTCPTGWAAPTLCTCLQVPFPGCR